MRLNNGNKSRGEFLQSMFEHKAKLSQQEPYQTSVLIKGTYL